jgi:transcription elongation factor Elf1
MIYARPTELTLSVTRETVDGACPACGASALQRYPVLAETGWFNVVKCQECLHSVSRERGAMYGHIQVYSSLLPNSVS